MTKEIGKIRAIRVGMGGYQNTMFGVSFTLGGKNGWGTGDFWGAWSDGPSEHAKWTKGDQLTAMGAAFWRLNELMRETGHADIMDLVGTPIEATFKDLRLDSWRIMTEVL